MAGVAYQVALMMLSDDLRNTGRFGPPVDVDDDAPIADQLAAFTGRTP